MTTVATPAYTRTGVDLGLLLLRLAVGLTMAVHGAQKLFGWFDGGGITGTGRFFAVAGYPAADTMAVVAGLTETVGGLGLAVGLLTPLSAAGILGVMINAMSVKGLGAFFAPDGIEYDLLLALAAASLALTGPGRFAVDHHLPRLREHRLSYGLAAIALGVVTGLLVVLVKS